MNFLSKKSSVKEAVIISNITNFLWYFWSFYLFFLVNTVYNEHIAGIFYIRNSYAALFSIISTWGISILISKIISYAISIKLINLFDTYKKLLYLIFIPSLIFVPFIVFLSFFQIITYIDILMLCIFQYFLFHGFFLALISVFDGLQKFRFSLFFTIIKLLIDTTIITLVLILKNIYVLLFYTSLFDIILILVITFFSINLIKHSFKQKSNYPRLMNKKNQEISNLTFLNQIKQDGLPLALITILGIISENFSRLFIGLFISEVILNRYIFASSVILVLARITNGFSMGLVPRLTELNLVNNEKKSQHLIINSCFLNEILVCIGVILIYIFYESFATIIFGYNFSRLSSEYINLLSLSLCFLAFSGSFSGFFISIGKTKYNLYSSILSSTSNIVIILFLASYIGIYAIILGFIISRSIIFYIIIATFLIKNKNKTFTLRILFITLYGIIFFIYINLLNTFFKEKFPLITSFLILVFFYYLSKNYISSNSE